MPSRKITKTSKPKPKTKPERVFRIFGAQPASPYYPAHCSIELEVEGRRVDFSGFTAVPKLDRRDRRGPQDAWWLAEKHYAKALNAIEEEHPNTWGELVTVWSVLGADA
jgi:hypothetical protein